jgi:hypothetical protein
MPVTFTYKGPFASVYLPAAGVTVARGESVEIADEHAAGLVGQFDSWETNDAAAVAAVLDSDDRLNHVGGGWYELPDGQRVQGREEALRALQTQTQSEG